MEPKDRTKLSKVILLTLDGVRTQEMFEGIDVEIVKTTLEQGEKLEEHPVYTKYWDPNPEIRREKIMPFFWSIMKSHGCIAGNRSQGSSVMVKNKHRFSYPGYSEIFTGEAHDDEVASNDMVQSPFKTVFEFVKEELKLPKEKVAAFASWGVTSFIAEKVPGSITNNCGNAKYEHSDKDERVKLLNDMQFDTLTLWEELRHDSFTHQFAMFHLKTFSPNLMYIGYGETDDWAHEGRYDRTIDALVIFDNCFKELWTFLQSSEEYKDCTILVTTDHGRGDKTTDWKDHEAWIDGAQHTWLAVVSPKVNRRGEWKPDVPIFANQIASTICQELGLDWKKFNEKMGHPVPL